MEIHEYHGTYNRSRRSGEPRYIVIHYTATIAPAINNCKYFAGGDRQASADYFVDDDGIWEYNDPASGYYTWAVGDGRGRYGITNNNSINIEVVNDGGAFSDAEIAHLSELVPYLMDRYGIPADRVVRHYDASRKRCPAGYVDDDAWQGLRATVTSRKQEAPKKKEPEVKHIENMGGDVYRLYNPNTGQHMYAFKGEADTLAKAGWKNEGVAFKAPKGGVYAIYRMYNPNTGAHMFTRDFNEAASLEKSGWVYEGVPFFGAASGKEVLRVYNPNNGDHVLTTSAAERASLVKAGWKSEGVAFLAA